MSTSFLGCNDVRFGRTNSSVIDYTLLSINATSSANSPIELQMYDVYSSS